MGCLKLTYNYPVGALEVNRKFSEDALEKNALLEKNRISSYTFGFQGQEKDDEVFGSTGTFNNFKFRGYDSRIGRFWSVDPLTAKYPFYSPYSFSGNRVIDAFELEGLEPVSTNPNTYAIQTIYQGTVDMFDAFFSLFTAEGETHLKTSTGNGNIKAVNEKKASLRFDYSEIMDNFRYNNNYVAPVTPPIRAEVTDKTYIETSESGTVITPSGIPVKTEINNKIYPEGTTEQEIEISTGVVSSNGNAAIYVKGTRTTNPDGSVINKAVGGIKGDASISNGNTTIEIGGSLELQKELN